MPEFEFDGLDIGGDDSATDEAFAEAFRRADGVTPEEPSDEVTPDDESAADEENDEGQPRDEQGRFARTQPEVTDLEEQQAEHDQELEEEPVEEEDSEVAAFLAKYGNDPEKALRAAVELSKLQGRQGDELGQLRQTVEELRQRLDAPQEPQRPAVPITEALVEELDSLAVESPQAALARVGQIGDPTGQLTDRVMDIWFQVNPRQASAFQAALIAQQTEQRVRAELEPIVQERGQSAEERAYVDSWNLALSKNPDMNDHAQAMHDLLQERPALARAVLASETVEERAQAFETVYELVAGRSAPPEVRQVAQQQQRQQAKEARTRAAVAKPSAVGSAPGAEEKEVSEEDRIKAGILGAKSTDILSGLTTD